MRAPVTKRYARALLDLGLEKGNHAVLQTQLRELADLYDGSPELRTVVQNPSVRVDERHEVLSTIAKRGGWTPFIRNLAFVLLDNDRFGEVGDIADEYEELLDAHAGNVRARVTTAQPLKDSQVATIKGAIAKLTGKTVLLETEVDPDILGGVITRVGSTLYDGSVRTQLEAIRESILDEV
jgi:F-type H+-transporting ATPase subunit delta